MSLYDGLDLEAEKDRTERGDISGWSSGIKLLQSQLQLKKAALTVAKKDQLKKGTVLPPVIDLKARKDEPEESLSPVSFSQNRENHAPNTQSGPFLLGDTEWNGRDEYDPMYPNDYEKIIKEQRERKEKERKEERRREYEERRRRNNERFREREEAEGERERKRRSNEDDDEESYERPRRTAGTGAAIAPPPSLMSDERKDNGGGAAGNAGGSPFGATMSRGGSVALKIMARYGFKEGQGLGKQEQGMSQALQVEKTSKRGGKIIHEKDLPKDDFMPPPPPPPLMSPNNGNNPNASLQGQLATDSESITEAMKNTSKVVLLRNMVGPGEVDDDLEPEVKEECAKYGEVGKCVIFEIPNNAEDEAVRIFVEFKRVESAIKAVIDLNGRYFGGRIVKAGFYNLDRFRRFDLGE